MLSRPSSPGKVDAVMEGFATVKAEAAKDSSLQVLDIEPINPALISMGVKQGDQLWLNYLNNFIRNLNSSGDNAALYEKWFHADLPAVLVLPGLTSTMSWYPGDLIPYLPVILGGLWISIYISVVSFVVGSVLGLFAYLGKAGKSRIVCAVSAAYIEVVRNVPLLVVLYLIYFGLTQFGINLDPLWSALIALTINNGAYVAEILRAGFESVPSGLREARMPSA